MITNKQRSFAIYGLAALLLVIPLLGCSLLKKLIGLVLTFNRGNSSFWNRILRRYGSENGEKECEKNVLHRLNSVSIISYLGRISGRNFRKSSCGKLIFIKKII